MYRARVERDSISPEGVRLTSFIIEFSRTVLAETVTHRTASSTWGEAYFCERTTTLDISKNSASSRAIPFSRMLDAVTNDPYMPNWTAHQKGMQGAELTDVEICGQANWIWMTARNTMIESAKALNRLGIAKQCVNRLIEPWCWVKQIVTSSAWDNFFALRCGSEADPAFSRIARMMFLARRQSTPMRLDYGQWHLPFVPLDQQMGLSYFPKATGEALPPLLTHSAARAAWVSYDNAEKDGTPEQMEATFRRLVGGRPLHGCYDAETEVLTGEGWKAWPDVTGQEKFATLSPDRKIEYHPASRLIAEDHDGPMYAIQTEHVDLLVTPGHNMLASRRTKWGFNDWSLLPVENLTKASHRIRLGGGVWESKPIWPDGWGQLLGFFIGDGNIRRIESMRATFHLRKRRKIVFLYEMARRGGFSVVRGTEDHYRLECSKEFEQYLRECYNADAEKIIPRHVLEMSLETLTGVYDGLINSDGHISKRGKIIYSSTSPCLVGQFQELMLKIDRYASVRLNSPEGISHWGGPAKALWVATVFQERCALPRIGWTKPLREKEVQLTHYTGRVYCVTVPNGTVYVRRNGKGAWCGNSPMEHQATPLLPGVLEGQPHWRSNLDGWLQARKLLKDERITTYNPSDEEVESWGITGPLWTD